MQDKVLLSDPITRIEGTARLVFVVDGENVKAYYQIMEFRGFEKLAVERHVEELPRIMSAICGVCSWSHHLASGKAIDVVFGRKPPPRAEVTRMLASHVQIIDSHLLHLGVMALPDLVFWRNGSRDILRLYRDHPEVASAALKARKVVRNIENKLGGKLQHASLVVPGGVSKALSKDDVNEIQKWFVELKSTVSTIHRFFDEHIKTSTEFRKVIEDDKFKIKALSMGLTKNGAIEFYDGKLKIVDWKGRVIEEIDDALKYIEVIGEAVVNWSYSKQPYYKPIGWRNFEEGSTFIVGPLARLNVAEKVYGEAAQSEYGEMIDAAGKPFLNVMLSHWARLVEILHCTEAIESILNDEERLLEGETVDLSGTPKFEGVGIVEAPRGTLIHHYKTDEIYVTKYANVITPTTFNSPTMSINLNKVGSQLVKEIKAYGKPMPESLSILESIVRAYDPCNSCATHCVVINNAKVFVSFDLIVITPDGEVLWRLS